MTDIAVLVEERTPGTSPPRKFSLRVPAGNLKVKDLIRLYVEEQVQRLNLNQIEQKVNCKFQVSESEHVLNPLLKLDDEYAKATMRT